MSSKLLRISQQHLPSRWTSPRYFRSSQHSNISKGRPALYSTEQQTPPPPSSPPPSPPPSLTDPSLPSFNLFHLLRDSRPAVRYTVYFGLGLMVTVESTFWFNVLKAKFFPAKKEQQRVKDDELLHQVSEAIRAFRGAWMGNYERYYGGYLWGVGER